MRGRALAVVVGCMVCQMGAGFFYASRALSADVIADLGWSRTMWASGMAPMLVISSVSQVFVGAACVRFGVRPVVLASLACLGVSVVVFGSMQNITHFYGAMMLLALANAGIGDVSIGSVITKWFERLQNSLHLEFLTERFWPEMLRNHAIRAEDENQTLLACSCRSRCVRETWQSHRELHS